MCTLLVYVWGGGCGSNWLIIAGLSTSKYLEHMLLPGADRRLACSATLVIFGYIYLVGGSRVCTLHVYLWGVVGGAKWLTIVGLSSLKHLERILFRGADHRLAYLASRVTFGQLRAVYVCAPYLCTFGRGISLQIDS